MQKKTILTALLVVLGLLTINLIIARNNQHEEPKPCQSPCESASEAVYSIPSNFKGYEYKVGLTLSKAVTQSKLQNANSLQDLVEHFPETWIDSYRHTIMLYKNGDNQEADTSYSKEFSTTQKQRINNFAIGDWMQFEVGYKRKNGATGELEEHTIYKHFTVVPEVQARYAEGEISLDRYFRNNVDEKLKALNHHPEKTVILGFVVESDGTIGEIEVKATSENKEVDDVLISAVRNLGSWIPAKNDKGQNVAQVIELTVGPDGC